MATLSVAARTKIFKGIMRWWSDRGVTVSGIVKNDLYNLGANTGAVAEADNWLNSAEGNEAPVTGYNNALNTTFKDNASAAMKGDLLLLISAIRQDSTGEYARRIVQTEID